jgi:hypothetical protein
MANSVTAAAVMNSPAGSTLWVGNPYDTRSMPLNLPAAHGRLPSPWREGG